MFGRSSTVSDDQLVARKLFDVILNVARGNELRSGDVSLVESVLSANINHEGFSFFHQRFELGGRDATCAIIVNLAGTARRRRMVDYFRIRSVARSEHDRGQQNYCQMI